MKSINCATLTTGKVNSLMNEIVMKSINCASLTLGKVDSVVNETLMNPINCAPLSQFSSRQSLSRV